LFGILGSYTRAGAAVNKLYKADKKLGWEIVGKPVEQKYSLNSEKFQQCIDLGKAMAERLKDFRK
jgi:flavorubredoxin